MNLQQFTDRNSRLDRLSDDNQIFFIRRQTNDIGSAEEKQECSQRVTTGYKVLKTLHEVFGSEPRQLYLCVPIKFLPNSGQYAIDMETKVVVKRCKKVSPRQRAEFEAQAFLTLRQPEKFVAPLLEFYETRDHYVSVTEAGEMDLLQFVNSDAFRSLGTASRLDYFQQCYKAVQYVHTMRLAHRDISLENFVISSNKVMLIDFGHVGAIDAEHRYPFGKLLYNPPEYYGFKANQKYDASKIDCFSLGVVLYCMLFFAMPWDTDARLYDVASDHRVRRLAGTRLHHMLVSMLKTEPIERSMNNFSD